MIIKIKKESHRDVIGLAIFAVCALLWVVTANLINLISGDAELGYVFCAMAGMIFAIFQKRVYMSDNADEFFYVFGMGLFGLTLPYFHLIFKQLEFEVENEFNK